jgi:hypothetical protein
LAKSCASADAASQLVAIPATPVVQISAARLGAGYAGMSNAISKITSASGLLEEPKLLSIIDFRIR